jgi:meso-butanediol dehydrogenase / (S,S)-butanediol dehydrogenase / diacetyl reductase
MTTEPDLQPAVVVTGGASGIGRGVVLRLAEAGLSVVAFDRDPPISGIAEEARAAEKRDRVVTVVGDVRNAADCEKAMTAALESFGRLTGLVNCAGVAPRGPLASTTSEMWESAVGVNLTGTFNMCQAAVGAMRRTKAGGSIVNIGTVGASAGIANLSAYAASKGGVLALTRQLAIELAPECIRVNSVSPGATDTPLFRARSDFPADPAPMIARLLEDYPLLHARGRLVQPRQIGGVVLFLLSQASELITGVDVPVDGGYLAR